MARTKKTMLYAALFLYCTAMLILLFLQRSPYSGPLEGWEYLREHVNLIPFQTIRQFAALLRQGGSPRLLRFAAVNLGGNVGVFVPAGLLLPCLWREQRRFRRFCASVAAAVVAVELAQLFTGLGICDVDDLILNLLGAAAGFWLWKSRPVNRRLLAWGWIV